MCIGCQSSASAVSATKASTTATPDLAVEVVSPEDRDSAVSAKVQQYLSAGTGRVWVVRPATQTVTVHRPDGSARTYEMGATLTSEEAGFAVAGFTLGLVRDHYGCAG